MGKVRRQFTPTPVGKPIQPDKVGWLHSEMLKTLVAHGYCARHPAAWRLTLCRHLRDLRTTMSLHPTSGPSKPTQNPADEAAHHDRVAHALTDHLHRLDR